MHLLIHHLLSRLCLSDGSGVTIVQDSDQSEIDGEIRPAVVLRGRHRRQSSSKIIY